MQFTKDDTQTGHDLILYGIIDGFDQSSTDAELAYARRDSAEPLSTSAICCLPPMRRARPPDQGPFA